MEEKGLNFLETAEASSNASFGYCNFRYKQVEEFPEKRNNKKS